MRRNAVQFPILMMRLLTGAELAEKANSHVNYVNAVERTEKNVTFESIEKIAEALNISFAEQFRFIDNKSNEDEVGQ